MLRMMRGKIPWILLFEAVMAVRRRWVELPPTDRARLTELARRSRGNPLGLTRLERAEFRRIAMGLDLFGVARDLAPMGRHLRRRH